jgi:hypothetical protein
MLQTAQHSGDEEAGLPRNCRVGEAEEVALQASHEVAKQLEEAPVHGRVTEEGQLRGGEAGLLELREPVRVLGVAFNIE